MDNLVEMELIIMDGITTTPLLTFICPTYNQARFLPSLLDGFLNQTRKDFAVVVGDDFSSDNTSEILRPYFSKFRDAGIKFKTIRQLQNLGVQSHGRDLLKYVETPYVSLLEGDDFCLPDRVETQLRFLEENPDYGCCHSDIQMLYEDGTVTDGFWDLCGGYPIETPMTWDFIMKGNRIFTCTLMAKTPLFKQAFNYDALIEKNIKLGDYYACLHLTKLCKIGYIPRPLSVYRKLSDSASHSMTREELLNETWRAQELARQDFGGLEQQWK